MARPPDYDVRARDVPIDLFPGGRVRFSLGPGSARQYKARRAACDEIRRWSAWDVLSAAARGEVTASDIHRSVRINGEGAVADIRRSLARRDEVPTVLEVAALMGSHIEAQSKSIGTIKSNQSIMRSVVAAIGSERIDTITPESAELAVGIKANGQKVGPGTRINRSIYLRRLVRFAHNMEVRIAQSRGSLPRWSHYDPVSLPGAHISDVRVATTVELAAIHLAATPYQSAYFRSLVRLGLRVGELIHTRYGPDFDHSNWVWKIQPRGPDPVCGCFRCVSGWAPKNRRSHRKLDLSRPELQGFRDSINRYLMQYPIKHGEYLFRNPKTGRPWRYNALKLDFYDLCKRAGVNTGYGNITLHVLRHTCATSLIQKGVLETIVAAILGDTIQMISNTYVHPTADDLGVGIARVVPFD